ncbi:MAG: S41 family peptidase [Dysgonamonadaceae bacterium]|jgi:carboxyl-terminal processing protease|nr:S41 family peptidase [Dysgonamonadaceae bacterium]
MKNLIYAAILALTMSSCSYGQGSRTRISGMPDNDMVAAIQKVYTAMNAVKNLYVDTINSSQLSENMIIDMLGRLDPHSSYLSADEVKAADEPLQGNFDGIGVQFNMLTDTLYIIQVISGGPSEKVGILAGDKIIKVDGTLIAGVKMDQNKVVSMLKGPKGTKVNVEILRRNVSKPINFEITRDRIPVTSLDAAYMLDSRTAYIKLKQFSATTYDEMMEALKPLQQQGMTNLIIDLQNNGGGYLKAAIDVANEFLKSGELIVYTEGVHQKRENAIARHSGSLSDCKLIVLVNEASASASEIVSGAIQDWDRGLIVGRRTFGKGLVQRPVELPDGSMIRLTTAHYYTPVGRSIQKPYVKGDSESYHRDLIDRYNRGEMISADSIHFPDSLKFNTLVNKRTVYGGGGIMPDYFVSIDTTGMIGAANKSTFYPEIANLIYKYSNRLVDNNRSEYKRKYPDFEALNKNFTITDKMFDDFLDMYRNEKSDGGKPVALTEEQQKDWEGIKTFVGLQIKSLIIRDLTDEQEYYRFSNIYFNEPLKKALAIINNSDEYNKLLGY